MSIILPFVFPESGKAAMLIESIVENKIIDLIGIDLE
jgi:hypothetical protein